MKTELEYEADISHGDDMQHEELQNMSDWEVDVKHQILDGAPKATFHYIGTILDWTVHDGHIISNGTLFVWSDPYGYNSYNLRKLGNSGGVQYICTGGGPVPIGYAQESLSEH